MFFQKHLGMIVVKGTILKWMGCPGVAVRGWAVGIAVKIGQGLGTLGSDHDVGHSWSSSKEPVHILGMLRSWCGSQIWL